MDRKKYYQASLGYSQSYPFVYKYWISQVVVMNTLIPALGGRGRSITVNSRPACSIYQVPDRQKHITEIPCLKDSNKMLGTKTKQKQNTKQKQTNKNKTPKLKNAWVSIFFFKKKISSNNSNHHGLYPGCLGVRKPKRTSIDISPLGQGQIPGCLLQKHKYFPLLWFTSFSQQNLQHTF